MKIQLETEQGEALRAVEFPRTTPWPDVVTLGAETFQFHLAQADQVSYRRCFAVNLTGYLPGGGLRDARIERA